MASPPFNINQAIPADNDIVSQHPTNARTFRDVVESWLLINHNDQGRHDEVQLDYKADPGSGTASVTEVWASSSTNENGTLKMRRGTGNVEYVGVPPGAAMDFWDDVLPEGYLWGNGSAVSRTTYARLFSLFSTFYGPGDGSTTFNLPDKRGRVSAAMDNLGGVSAAGRIGTVVTDNGTIVGTTLGSSGGSSTHAQTNNELISHFHTPPAITDPGHTHNISPAVGVPSNGTGGGVGGSQTVTSGSVSITQSTTTGISLGNTGNTGGSAAMAWLQPTIMCNYIIKY